jgi:hypothetical protein
LAGQYQRQALAERWPDQPLGVLDGRTPRQAAADPAAKVRVLATLMVVEHWCERWVEAPNLNELRTRLGLPTLEPIELAPGEIDWLPLVRLARVRVENLSDDDLLAGFHRAVAMQALKALRKLARAVADRPGFAGRPERLDALGTLARSAENIEEALSSIEEGRRVAIAAGKSCAPWDMLEVPFRFGRGQPAEAVRLVQHLQQRHIQEPGVAQALTQLLVELGLLHPDGTPVARPDAAAPLAAGPMADQRPADEPGRLWTPDSGAAPGGGGKLWTPGS